MQKKYPFKAKAAGKPPEKINYVMRKRGIRKGSGAVLKVFSGGCYQACEKFQDINIKMTNASLYFLKNKVRSC